MESNISPDDFFIRDVFFFLVRPSSQNFNFKNENLEPFFILLAENWEKLDRELIDIIEASIPQIRWLSKILLNNTIYKKISSLEEEQEGQA